MYLGDALLCLMEDPNPHVLRGFLLNVELLFNQIFKEARVETEDSPHFERLVTIAWLKMGNVC
jgi:hypothetical protein